MTYSRFKHRKVHIQEKVLTLIAQKKKENMREMLKVADNSYLKIDSKAYVYVSNNGLTITIHFFLCITSITFLFLTLHSLATLCFILLIMTIFPFFFGKPQA